MEKGTGGVNPNVISLVNRPLKDIGAFAYNSSIEHIHNSSIEHYDGRM